MEQSGQIRFLNYNIFLRPPPVFNFPHSDYKNQRLELFIENELKNWDVICFQEVFSTLSTRRNRLIQAAEDQGFAYHALPPNPDLLSYPIIDSGLLILSRLPIVET